MRTPGRCTNFDTCWLANGQRDIRVMVGDPFVCPACGEPLHAPSIESISASGIVGALAISLAMVATAGGAGYGLVRVAQTAGTSSVASYQAPRTPAVASVNPAAANAAVASLGHEPIRMNPSEQRQTIRLADSVPVLQVDPSKLPVVFVAAAPPHPLVLPINFGRPHAPEDDAPAQSARWHHHAFGVRHRTYSAPVPVWSADDEQAMQQAQQGMPPAQGDSDADASAAPMASPDQAANDVALQADRQDMVPDQQADTSVPGVTRVADEQNGAYAAPTEITRLIVPAMASLHDVPAYQPAERIDPSDAAVADHSQNAAFVLATLPRAKANKLAVPVYPAQLAAEERAGRVDVGCVITETGLPSGCQVQREEGGHSFSHAVMNWLKSGSVRYRPSVVDGQPAAEPRDYKVRFEP